MPKRALIIGLGGTGKASLTILKERLLETYSRVPDTVVLLAFDTDDLQEMDDFAGVRLDSRSDKPGHEPEFHQYASPPGITMDTIFADIASGRKSAYMGWLEKEKLDRIISPAERDIRGGAQQRRPLGRVALFLQWGRIYDAILDVIARMYGEADEEPPVDVIDIEKGKRLIFIVGSVAGGTGSGFLIDVANLVRHAIRSNTNWQSVDVSAIIVLPDAFRAYAPRMEDPTNLKPNSYAALRELDRFMRTHGAELPYMVRYGKDLDSITWSTHQPLDHIYLVDTASRTGGQDFNLSGDPMQGVFPVIADFIMAHIDHSMGNALATLRSNAGQHYDKDTGRMYSSFNVMTYIFPVDDVIESFSYRFLREMLARQFLPIPDKKTRALMEQEAVKETERVFAENSVGGKVNPGVIQKAIASTRRMDPETPDVSWPGLFNLIALSESAFAEDYQDLDQSLVYLASNLIPTKEGEFKHENYDEGYIRLLNFGEQFMDDFLGPQSDPDDEESRFGGDWDKILGRYRNALRQRFAAALDAALLEVLNRRDPNTHVMEPFLVPYARAMVATLKDQLVSFKALLRQEYREQQIDTRIRQTGEELRNAITWMYETRDSRGFALLRKPEARKAQDAYIGLLVEKMELVLHQRIYRTVLDVLDALGAAERDSAGRLSVLDVAAQELENWQATFQEVDRIIRDRARVHEGNREAKRRVKVRHYLTDPQFEEQLYQQPEHSGMVAMQVMGQVQDTEGLAWQRLEETEPLYYKLVTTWGEEAKGAEEIARTFFAGLKDFFQVVRENATLADRVAAGFTSPASFANTVLRVEKPFLRYNPALNAVQDDPPSMFHERYVSFNLSRASDEARRFLEQGVSTLADQGVNVDREAESLVACAVAEVARGVRLGAVDQFVACEPDYRSKLYPARESLHIFPEEQVAADYEGRIESLGEPDHSQRPLAPELVIAMGDKVKLKAFTLACAYGLIDQGFHLDPGTGEETTELFLTLRHNGQVCRLLLSQRRLMRELDPRFDDVAGEEQLGRLYLNALQNFVLKATEIRGAPHSVVPTLVEDLKGRGVSLEHIENPFTLSVREINQAIRGVVESLVPSEEEPDRWQREVLNARQRVERHLQPFLLKRVAGFKRSPAPRVRDMGKVMHLILREEINSLIEQEQSKAFPVILEYDTVLSMFSSLGRRRASGVVWVLPDDEGPQFHAEQEQHLLQICNHFGKLLHETRNAP